MECVVPLPKRRFDSETPKERMERLRTHKDDVDLVLYHGCCCDGVSAYSVARKYLEGIGKKRPEGVPCFHGDANSWKLKRTCENRTVLILDFSFPAKLLRDLKRRSKRLILLDHHESAREMLKRDASCYFDTEKSGVGIAWEFFYHDAPMPEFLSRVQDADLWKMDAEGSREFAAKCETMSMEPDVWLSAINDAESVPRMIKEGAVELEYKRHAVNEIIEQNRKTFFSWRSWIRRDRIRGKEYATCLIECGTYVNEVGESICESLNCDIAIMWRASGIRSDIGGIEVERKACVLSLRSATVDTSTIASFYGGGGHPGASAFLWTGSIEKFVERATGDGASSSRERRVGLRSK
jgi:oligoribonuclease NrnB/cAMP/cGMP phosphodiesterase (DHH superfamily)